MNAEIRPLTEPEWEVLRSLRLRALEDSPSSFGPPLDSALAQPELYWRNWAGGRPGRLQAWAAFIGREPVALISAGVPREEVAHFGALWVAPAARGGGLAGRLIETVILWAAGQGCHTMELDVTEGNPAERLYEAIGFRRTGASKPLRDGSPLVEVTMALPLTPETA